MHTMMEYAICSIQEDDVRRTRRVFGVQVFCPLVPSVGLEVR